MKNEETIPEIFFLDISRKIILKNSTHLQHFNIRMF